MPVPLSHTASDNIILLPSQQEALFAIQQSVICREANIDKVMETVVQGVLEVIPGIDGAAVEMRDGADIVYRAVSGTLSQCVGFRLPMAGSLSGLCIDSAAIMECMDTENDPRVNIDVCRRLNIRSMIVVPIIHRGDVIGVLKICSDTPHAFNAHHRLLVQFFINVIAAGFGMVSDTHMLEALRQSEERFRKAMENASIGMALVSLKGKFLTVNNALCQLTGYSNEELRFLDFQSITHPEDLHQDMAYIQQMLNGDIDHYQVEKRCIHKKGHVVWILLSVSLAREMLSSPSESKPKNFIAQIQNISARKEVETLKNEFISTVSHELKTPLTSIHASLGLMASGKLGMLPEAAEKAMRIAYRNSERLKRIISAILDVDQIESGHLRLSPTRFNLRDFLQHAVETCQSYGDKYNVHFNLLEVEANIFIHADYDKLMQVMANLLSNAAKFSAWGAEVHIYALREDGRVKLYVRDFGIGIAPAFYDRIFGKFEQADASASRRYEGTGLGLNITKQLVEAMRGTIHFSSQEGDGTIFYVNLPAE